ncbi:MAG: phosphorylase [Betaproteobacteria bacterium]|nr:phosphorylase [Betaproteobacteria bacterium]MBI3937307.1 phosphorylase [Betaproteobacteria bacterium]
MSAHRVLFKPATLWPAVLERTRHALARGALAPIETAQEVIEDGGVRFVVRRVSSLAHKAEDRARREERARPADLRSAAFPIEQELFVAEVSDTHVAVLNKFPVIPHHLLLVTRRYVDQEALPDEADFEALAACLREFDSLGFYNGGVEAGASQPHKHLQLVPLPLGADRAAPVEALFKALRAAPGIRRVPGLPFRHAFAWCEPVRNGAGTRLFRTFHSLFAAAGLGGTRRDGVLYQSAPYNMLIGRDWMLVVPRSRECFEGISINALGFAGSLFVKNEHELARVRRAGPMAVLAAVAVS